MAFLPALDLAMVTGAVVLQLGLAAWLYAASPRSAVHRAFALFLLSNAAGDLAQGFDVWAGDDRTAQALFEAGYAAYYVGATALVWLALAYPHPRLQTRRQRMVLAGVAGFNAVGILTLVLPPWANDASALVSSLSIGLQGPAVAWISRRLGEGDERRRRSTRLVVVGLCTWPFWVAGDNLSYLLRGDGPAVDLLGNALIALTAGMATVAAAALARRAPDGRRGLLPLAFLAAFFLLGFLGAGRAGVAFWAYYATSMALVGIVAYGILRHDLFTLDRKVHFAVKGSTLAAIFVAVFFVASETAQEVFGARNPYLGIAAAGALVFVLTPLQRVADRVANAAVPAEGGRSMPGQATARDEELYAKAVRLAVRDGRLDPADRLDLLEMAERLGIGARRAAELEAAAVSAARAGRRRKARR